MRKMYIIKQIESLHEDGKVLFNDGSWVIADTIIFCTGYVNNVNFIEFIISNIIITEVLLQENSLN